MIEHFGVGGRTKLKFRTILDFAVAEKSRAKSVVTFTDLDVRHVDSDVPSRVRIRRSRSDTMEKMRREGNTRTKLFIGAMRNVVSFDTTIS